VQAASGATHVSTQGFRRTFLLLDGQLARDRTQRNGPSVEAGVRKFYANLMQLPRSTDFTPLT
jgi:hypothetical protein